MFRKIRIILSIFFFLIFSANAVSGENNDKLYWQGQELNELVHDRSQTIILDKRFIEIKKSSQLSPLERAEIYIWLDESYKKWWTRNQLEFKHKQDIKTKLEIGLVGYADKIGFKNKETNIQAAHLRLKNVIEAIDKWEGERTRLKIIAADKIAWDGKDVLTNKRGVDIIAFLQKNPTPMVEPELTISETQAISFPEKIAIKYEKYKEKWEDLPEYQRITLIVVGIIGGIFLLFVFLLIIRAGFNKIKNTKANRSQVLVTGVLICLAIGFFYLQYHKDQEKKKEEKETEKTIWEYKIKKGQQTTVNFFCKAEKYYTFAHSPGFTSLTYFGQRYELFRKNIRVFFLKFKKNTNIQLQCDPEDGVFINPTTFLTVQQGVKKGYELVSFPVKEYSDFKIYVEKGSTFTIPARPHHWKIAIFKNDELEKEFITEHKVRYSWDFWNNREIRFKSPYYYPIIVFGNFPYSQARMLTVKIKSPLKQKDIYKKPCFLEEGGEYDTDIYFGEDDEFNASGKSFNQYTFTVHNSSRSITGYTSKRNTLVLKAKVKIIVDQLIIYREPIEFNLKSGQEKKIKIFEGDLIWLGFDDNSYLDNKFMEAGTKFGFLNDKDQIIQFKSAGNQAQIRVYVLDRKVK